MKPFQTWLNCSLRIMRALIQCRNYWLSLFLISFFLSSAHAQVADPSTGIPVNIIAQNIQYYDDTSTSDAVRIDIQDINTTASILAGASDLSTVPCTIHILPGKMYVATVSCGSGASFEFHANAPKGCTMEIESVQRSCYSVSAASVIHIHFRVLTNIDLQPTRAGTSTALGSGFVYWQVSLGVLSNGQSAGRIGFIDAGTGSVSSLFDVSNLICTQTSSEVSVLTDPNNQNVIRQVITPQVCVDVTVINSNQCQLKFYHRSQVNDTALPHTTFSGYPYAWYIINQFNVTTNSVTINCDIRNPGDSTVQRSKTTTLTRTGTSPNFTWTASTWHGLNDSALSKVVRTRANWPADSSAAGVETDLVQDLKSNTALYTQNTYIMEPWGPVISQSVRGSTSPITTKYSYYDDSSQAQSGYYGNIKTQQITGQNWISYLYYGTQPGVPADTGAVYQTYSPYAGSSSAPTTNPSSNSGVAVTTYTYDIDAFGGFTRPAGITVAVDGITCKQTTYTYSDSGVLPISGHGSLGITTCLQQVSTGANSKLITVSKFFHDDLGSVFGDDFFRSLPYSTTNPDGTKLDYAYQRGQWSGTTFSPSSNGGADLPSQTNAVCTAIIRGQDDAIDGADTYTNYNGMPVDTIYLINGKSTMHLTFTDNYCQLAREEDYIWANSQWNLVSYNNYTSNLAFQVTKKTSGDGSNSTSTFLSEVYKYAGERLIQVTDAAGITKKYDYDTEDRLYRITKVGIGGSTNIYTTSVLDALGHATSTTRSSDGTAETIATTTAYDDAGRITSYSLPGSNGAIQTSIQYNPASDRKTTTYPNSGTRIETFNPDGSIQSITGTGVIPEYYNYTINSDGKQTITKSIGTSTSDRYITHAYDWVDREIKTTIPTFNPAYTYSTVKIFDPSSGQLDSTYPALSNGTQLAAPTLLNYDELGAIKRIGLSISGNSTLTTASTDRIIDASSSINFENGAWWLISTKTVYPTSQSQASQVAETTKMRLTGLGYSYSGVSGIVIAEQLYINADGITTRQLSVLNSDAATLTHVTICAGLSNASTEVSINGLVVSNTGFDGILNTTGYDSLERPSTIVTPQNGSSNTRTTTTTYYSGTEKVYQKTNFLGEILSTYVYDDAGRVVLETNTSNYTTRLDYNLSNQVVHIWGSAATPAQYHYNSFGQCDQLITYLDKNAATSFWDSNKWPDTSGIDAAHTSVTNWTYDTATGLLKSKADASGAITSFTYYPTGQLQTRTTARNITSTYSYDQSTNELSSISYSDGTPSIGYTYTRCGQVSTVTDAAGTHSYVYASGQLLRLDHEELPDVYGKKADGYGKNLFYQYDSYYRPAGVSLAHNSSGWYDTKQIYAYNTLGQINRISDSLRADDAVRTFSYSYTNKLATGVSVSAGCGAYSRTKIYELNRDLLSSAANVLTTSSGTTNIASYNYTYINALGQKQTALQTSDSSVVAFNDYGSSTYYNYQYNSRGELIQGLGAIGASPSLSAPVGLPGRNFTYEYDSAGNRSRANRSDDADGADVYSTNNLNQYSNRNVGYVHTAGTVVAAGSNQAVQVSVAGSNGVTTKTVSQQGRFWDAALQAPSSVTGPLFSALTIKATLTNTSANTGEVRTDTTRTALLFKQQVLTYDADGNLTNDGLWSYSYDAENQLVAMVAIAGQAIQKLQFKYDYLGRRVEKVVQTSSTTTTRRYVYNGNNLVGEYSVNGSTIAIVRSYTWGIDNSNSITGAGGVGGLLEIVTWSNNEPSSRFYPAYDGNGNVVAFINDSTGAVAAAYEYSPFGEPLRATAYDSTLVDQPIRFSSKFYDVETGLVYYGARYYSPMLGRFINRDPIGESSCTNLYSFVRNDSQNFFDYMGYEAKQADYNSGRLAGDGMTVTASRYHPAWEEDWIGDSGSGRFSALPAEWRKSDLRPYIKITAIRLSYQFNYQFRVTDNTKSSGTPQEGDTTHSGYTDGTEQGTLTWHEAGLYGAGWYNDGPKSGGSIWDGVGSAMYNGAGQYAQRFNQNVWNLVNGTTISNALGAAAGYVTNLVDSGTRGATVDGTVQDFKSLGRAKTWVDTGNYLISPQGLADTAFSIDLAISSGFSTNCFPAGTKVSTPSGDQNIEDIKIGDVVYAYDFALGKVVESHVIETPRHFTYNWMSITVDGEIIRSTRGHRFWVESEKAWVEAVDLKAGMTVRLRDGTIKPITAVSLATLTQSEPTYNLEIENQHTYFVGLHHVLVHNPDFIVTPGGQVFPVPSGATGPTSPRASGFMFTGGSGGNGLDPRVTGVRFMDANWNQDARAVYMNAANQTVNPFTGKTIAPSDPLAHIPCW